MSARNRDRDELPEEDDDTASGPDLDRASIWKIQRAGGAPLVARITSIFLDDAPARFEMLRRTLKAEDLVRAAHGFKTNCRMMGAEGMARLCQRLVELAEDAVDGRDGSTFERGSAIVAREVDALEAAYPEVRVWVELLRDRALRGEAPPEVEASGP